VTTVVCLRLREGRSCWISWRLSSGVHAPTKQGRDRAAVVSLGWNTCTYQGERELLLCELGLGQNQAQTHSNLTCWRAGECPPRATHDLVLALSALFIIALAEP